MTFEYRTLLQEVEEAAEIAELHHLPELVKLIPQDQTTNRQTSYKEGFKAALETVCAIVQDWEENAN